MQTIMMALSYWIAYLIKASKGLFSKKRWASNPQRKRVGRKVRHPLRGDGIETNTPLVLAGAVEEADSPALS